MLLETLIVLFVGLFIAVACVIVIKYRKTRDAGFLWLGAAVLLWPLLAVGLRYAEKVMMNRATGYEYKQVGIYPFSLIETGQVPTSYVATSFNFLHQIIFYVLILVGVAILYRNKARP